jgi:DNA (cytosine-5)-methyltransferase 1
MDNRFTFIDLFAGIGGFRIALESFGGECVFSSEIDENARSVYQLNFKELPHGDITKIHEKNIPKHDVLCAGFPCQAFSVSGKRLGFKDARGTLFFEIARIIKKRKPKIVFLENVKNFLKHDNGKTFLVVKKSLEDLGYDVHYKVICSSDQGVPQSRERIYIVAFLKNLKVKDFQFPNTTKMIKKVEDILIKLSKAESEKLKIKRDDIQKIENPKRPFQIGIINKGGQGERIYSIKAQAITLSAHGGGIAAKTGAYYVNGVVRRLHPRECLSLQGFPRKYKLHANDNVSYKQLGNSVSVPVLKNIFKEIIKQTSFVN